LNSAIYTISTPWKAYIARDFNDLFLVILFIGGFFLPPFFGEFAPCAISSSLPCVFNWESLLHNPAQPYLNRGSLTLLCFMDTMLNIDILQAKRRHYDVISLTIQVSQTN